MQQRTGVYAAMKIAPILSSRVLGKTMSHTVRARKALIAVGDTTQPPGCITYHQYIPPPQAPYTKYMQKPKKYLYIMIIIRTTKKNKKKKIKK